MVLLLKIRSGKVVLFLNNCTQKIPKIPFIVQNKNHAIRKKSWKFYLMDFNSFSSDCAKQKSVCSIYIIHKVYNQDLTLEISNTGNTLVSETGLVLEY